MSMRTTGVNLVSTLLLVGAAVACGDDEQTSDLNKDFAGREFVFDGGDGFTPVSPTAILLSFQKSTLLCYAGCSMLDATYSELGGALVVNDVHASTKGCSEEAAAQDQWLSRFLRSNPKFALDGRRLALISPDATLTFREGGL
ncbi:MAG TPA: META domain-containing protein [Polyangiaceae bacterium]|nr:META domain-containing protein [Polyangiaceae bacterium]